VIFKLISYTSYLSNTYRSVEKDQIGKKMKDWKNQKALEARKSPINATNDSVLKRIASSEKMVLLDFY